MENNIEEEFFKTFRIEPFIYCCKPRLDCPARKVGTCTKECEYYSGILYPQITSDILLELICILGTIHLNIILQGTIIKQLKDYILNECIENRKCINEQVCSLFEGVEE